MNTSSTPQTGSQIDEIYRQVASYKKAAKVVSITSYVLLLLGVLGLMPFIGFGLIGALIGLNSVLVGFILWILLQLLAEILRVISRKKLSTVSGAVDSEIAMLKRRNIRNGILFLVCMLIIGIALVVTVLVNQ